MLLRPDVFEKLSACLQEKAMDLILLVLRKEAIGIMILGRVGIEGKHVDKLSKREQSMEFTLQEERKEVIKMGKEQGQGNGAMLLVRAGCR